jgi:uroporphyrinogen-III synthase
VNVVVTREAGWNDALRAWLPPEATVAEVPLTATTYFSADDVRATLEGSRAHGMYRVLVVTSERSAEYVEMALRSSTLDVEVYSVGPTTTEALTSRGVRVLAQAEGSANSLARLISRSPVLLLGAKAMRDDLAESLRTKGLEVVMVACYETLGVTLSENDIGSIREADVVLIGAPSAWAVARGFVSNDTWVVVPGDTTAKAVRADHSRVIEGWGPDLRERLAERST